MPPKDGSVWIEEGKFCYIDDKGNKKCQDFAQITQNFQRIQQRQEQILKRIKQIQNAVFFDVEITSTNSPLKVPGELEVEVKIENTGATRGSQDIFLTINGDALDNTSLTLDTGEQKRVTFQIPLTTDEVTSSSVEVAIRSDDTVSYSTVDLTYSQEFSVVIRGTNSPINAGNDLTVDVDITNIGDSQDTQQISLDINGQRDSQEVTLSPSSSQSITLTWSNADVGNYTAFVKGENGSDSVDVTVNGVSGEAFFDVEIRDITEVSNGGDVDFTIGVTNIGDTTATQTIELESDGFVRDSQSLQLSASASQEITLTHSSASAGYYDAKVSSANDSATQKYSVLASGPFLGVTVESTNSPIPKGGRLIVDVEVVNIGDESAGGDVTLFRDGSGDLTSQSVQLNSGEKTNLSFEYDVPEEWKETVELGVYTLDQVKRFEILIGDAVGKNAGVIIHEEPGNTIEGVFVDKDDWVEIFGDAVHFSENA